jgi:hypothetical protein
MTVKTYDPAQVLCIVAGVEIKGYADGTFITCGRDNPAWTNGSGASGEGWRAKSNDKIGTCTLTLLQTSESNDLLSALANLDELSGNGVGAFLLKDNSGNTLYSAETCWIEKQADSEFARDVTNREWVVKTDLLNVFVGGN